MNELTNIDAFNLFILKRQIITFIMILSSNALILLSFIMGVNDIYGKYALTNTNAANTANNTNAGNTANAANAANAANTANAANAANAANPANAANITFFGLTAEQVAIVGTIIGSIAAFFLAQTSEINYERKAVQILQETPQFTPEFLSNMNLITRANFILSSLFTTNLLADYQQRHRNIFYY